MSTFPHPIKTFVKLLIVSLIGLLPFYGPLPAPTQSAPLALASHDLHFLHFATSENITNNSTYLDHPTLNGNPNIQLIVTPHLNPGQPSGSFVYSTHPIGVWYDASVQQWAIFNQNLEAMSAGAAFNVLAPAASERRFIHTVTTENIYFGEFTIIDHPAANNNPNANIQVTANWQANAGPGIFNPHPTGVYYLDVFERWAIVNEDFATLTIGTDFNVYIPSMGTFRHEIGENSSASYISFIDHPDLNGNPNAYLHITKMVKGGNPQVVYNPHEVGVAYNYAAQRWMIFNIDLTPLPANLTVNVFVPEQPALAFKHTVADDNPYGSRSVVDHPQLNGNPDAIVHLTQNWNPPGSGGISNDQPIAMWYEDTLDRWTVFNPSSGSLPSGAAFNLYLPSPALSSFVHATTGDNNNLNSSYIDHPLTNGRPNAQLLVTQAIRRIGTSYTYNPRPVGVWYDTSVDQWAIFNQDIATMGQNLRYNVTVLDSSSPAVTVHTVAASSLQSELDVRLANDNPHAMLFITPNWNHGGGVGVYNNHNPGVRYTQNGRWAIFNQDDEPLPAGAAFNVLVIGHKLYLPTITH